MIPDLTKIHVTPGETTHIRRYTRFDRRAYWACSAANWMPCKGHGEPKPEVVIPAYFSDAGKPCPRNHPMSRMKITYESGKRKRRCQDCGLMRFRETRDANRDRKFAST